MTSDSFGLVGTTIAGKYRVDRVLGEGGFGVVYAGRHLIVDEPIAIKCIKVTGGGAGDAERAADAFLREARALFTLTHPAIVRMYDVGALPSAFGPVPYVVLELVEGSSLEDELERRLRARAPFTPSEILLVMEPVLEAVAFAHERGIAHRDLKPSNVMIVRPADGPLSSKVLDFGMARLGSATVSAGAVGFTPGYAAPEQWDPALGAAGARSDVFALGLMLAEMCTLEQVLDGEGIAQIFAATRAGPGDLRISSRRPDLPPEVEQVAARATRVRDVERFADARELLEALRAAFGRTIANPTSPPSPIVQRVVITQTRAPSVAPILAGLAVMILAMIALAVVGALLLGQRRAPRAAVAEAPSGDGPVLVTPAPLGELPVVAPRADGSSSAPPPSPRIVRTARVVGAGDEQQERTVRVAIEARMDELRGCYGHALATQPSLQGEASLMLRTGDDGAVSSVLVGGDGPVSRDPTIRACMMRFGRSFTFPAVKNSNFIYVLSFGA